MQRGKPRTNTSILPSVLSRLAAGRWNATAVSRSSPRPFLHSLASSCASSCVLDSLPCSSLPGPCPSACCPVLAHARVHKEARALILLSRALTLALALTRAFARAHVTRARDGLRSSGGDSRRRLHHAGGFSHDRHVICRISRVPY